MKDVFYARHPYDEKLPDNNHIGYQIYCQLRNTYNSAVYNDNTVVIYTVDGFLNAQQSGSCIVNYYKYITEQMETEECFCGERVGVLVQEKTLAEYHKDDPEHSIILQQTGELILIGVNQATYTAYNEILRLFRKEEDTTSIEIRNFLKEFTHNQGVMFYPEKPVYVSRVRNKLQSKIWEIGKRHTRMDKFYCLYHMMLRNLRHTRQIVVDITENTHQSLFWLGMAHGSGVHAVSVKLGGNGNSRGLVDVAGLWSAILVDTRIEDFYRQLEQVQMNICFQSKLMMHEPMSMYWHSSSSGEKKTEGEIKEKLESFYRHQFWNAMLHENSLCLYVKHHDKPVPLTSPKPDEDPRLFVVKWDMNAVSRLSSYLSKRTVIGEYEIKALEENGRASATETRKNRSFISIGSAVKPLENKVEPQELAAYINEQSLRDDEKIFAWKEYLSTIQCAGFPIQFKGFGLNDEKTGIFTQHTRAVCGEDCAGSNTNGDTKKYITSKAEADQCGCQLSQNRQHTQIGQLLLWRDKETTGNINYYVALNGSSGPATEALTTLLVSHNGKDAISFLPKERTILYDLQEKLREAFLKDFFERADVKKHSLCNAARAYLDSVLYQYFLPFLSGKQEKQLGNGMRFFLRSYASQRLREDREQEIDELNNEFRNALNRFRGIEAYFEIEVSVKPQTERSVLRDTRNIERIDVLGKEAQKKINWDSWVKCLFLKEQ